MSGTVNGFGWLNSAEDLIKTVEELGFLPFFKNPVEGFSIAEHTPPEKWFVEGVEGPWEWKGPAARSGRCAYGKFFRGKSGYVSRELLPHFVNYRRDGYDYDARFDDGLMTSGDKSLLDIVYSEKSLLSTELREMSGYGKNGQKGFDRVITGLQMQTYVLAADFEYAVNKNGREYGWGIARYSSPESLFGAGLIRSCYKYRPEESFAFILDRLKKSLPGVEEKKIIKLISI